MVYHNLNQANFIYIALSTCEQKLQSALNEEEKWREGDRRDRVDNILY